MFVSGVGNKRNVGLPRTPVFLVPFNADVSLKADTP
jgi:hypothetical protein